MEGMITFEEAYRTVMDSVFRTAKESVAFTESLGRVLAAPVKSDMNMPPWDRSTVDGYACRMADLGAELALLETIAAGTLPTKIIAPGTCSRIMTGAAVPQGADYVFMLEDSEVKEGGRVVFRSKPGKPNIAYAGEDVRRDETVLTAGQFVKPQDIGVMAMTGAVSVTVARRPKVGVISTGNEIIEPDLLPSGAQIRNSNGSMLMAQLLRAGAEGRYYGIAGDTEASAASLLHKAVGENDVVLVSGGVSEGDFDVIPAVIKSLGFTIHFDKVAVQPGKPLTFCTADRKVIFGLPGNPVSVFVQFEMMVRPYLAKMMGATAEEPHIMLPLATDYSRKRADRLAFIPVMMTKEGAVKPVEYHGSAHISALPKAWGIIAIPKGQSWIQKGEMVSVRQI